MLKLDRRAALLIGVGLGAAIWLVSGGVIAEPASGGLWPLGILFLGMYSVLALLGAGLGASVRRFGGDPRPTINER